MPAYLYLLQAPTHLVYGISGQRSKTNRLLSYRKDRKLILKMVGTGAEVLAVETKLHQLLPHYIGSPYKGEKKESVLLGMETSVQRFGLLGGLTQVYGPPLYPHFGRWNVSSGEGGI